MAQVCIIENAALLSKKIIDDAGHTDNLESLANIVIL